MKLPRFRGRGCYLFALLWAVLTAGCSRSAPVSPDTNAAKGTGTISQSREADDVARFVAGLPGTAGSPFAEMEKSAAWQEHRRLEDAAWRKANEEMISALRDFQKHELDSGPWREARVFYPFSGPDSLTPVICFPHSPAYVMVALEPAGTLPAAKEIARKPLPKYLAALRSTTASELGKSFFVTREMDRKLRGQVTDGLLLPILELLVRSGHTILGFRYVRLEGDGRVVDRPANYKGSGEYWNKGVEVAFRTDTDQSEHRLSYYAVNLEDKRLRGNQAFLRYASGLNGVTTLLKATSYMTHHPEFSMIRDLVLKTSSAVLQDDSGIPYQWFQSGAWNVQLYGDYKRPYGSFRWLEQPDLRRAYGSSGVKPLAVPIGYGYRRIVSNLLLAQRASAPR
jgi:hypothetical protein